MSLPRVCLLLVWSLVVVSAAAGEPPSTAKPRLDRYGDPLPPGAVARLGTLRFYGGRGGDALAISPNAKLLATGDVGDVGGVEVTDANTGKQLWHFADEKEFSSPPVFSGDGKRLAAGRSEEVFLWDARTGRELRRFQWRDERIALVWIGLDGKTVAAATSAGNACWWDVATGKELRRWNFPSIGRPTAFSPDGQTMVYKTTRFRTSEIVVWDTRRGKELWRQKLDATIRAFPASGEGKYFALVDGGRLSFRSFRTGKELKSVKWSEEKPWLWPVELALSTDGKVLASAHGDLSICLWDVASGKLRRHIKRQWHGSEGPLIGQYIALSRDGKVLAARRGHWTRLWDTTTGREIPSFEGHRWGVDDLFFTPDGSLLCSRASCHFIHWKRRDWGEAGRFDVRREWGYTDPPPPGTNLILADEKEGKVWLCDLTSGKTIRVMTADQPHCDGGQLSRDGKVLALLYGDEDVQNIILRATKSGKVLRRITGVKKPEYLRFSTDGKVLIWYDKEGQFWATDAVKDRPAQRIGKAPRYPHQETRWSAVSPGGRQLAVARWINGLRPGQGGIEPKLRLWDTVTGKELLTFEGTADGVAALTFSPDGRMLAGVDLGTPLVRVWEVATGKERFRLAGHRNVVQCLTFSPDGKLLLSGSDDGTILVWDLLRPPAPARTRS